MSSQPNQQQPPATPKTPKADVNTLAFLLKEIDIRIEAHFKAQRIAGAILFVGGFLLFAWVGSTAPASPLIGAAALISAYGFSRIF